MNFVPFLCTPPQGCPRAFFLVGVLQAFSPSLFCVNRVFFES